LGIAIHVDVCELGNEQGFDRRVLDEAGALVLSEVDGEARSPRSREPGDPPSRIISETCPTGERRSA
jgi:hypothetical protein